jgi:hypothetical protein
VQEQAAAASDKQQPQAAAAAAAPASSSGADTTSSSSSSQPDNSQFLAGVSDAPPVSPKTEAQLSQQQYIEIYDRLIKIFQERPREDWKRLIVFSRQWPQHKQGVFDRYGSVARGGGGGRDGGRRVVGGWGEGV